MRYIPNTDDDLKAMLKEIGVKHAGELFSAVPGELILEEELNLPSSLSEIELLTVMERLAEENAHAGSYKSFLGGGIYNHFIPSAVKSIVSRSEFYTSYTPYQPEVSQGTLQAMFEFQTLMCQLLSMGVSNASLYCGASSTAEAVLMALRIKRSSTVVVSKAVHPDYRRVIRTYCSNGTVRIVEAPYDGNGVTDTDCLKELIDDDTAAVVIQSPNFFGVIEDLDQQEKLIHGKGALFISVFTEPVAFGLLKPPGEYGADICCGEGQSLGIPPGFGGPHLGILTAKEEYLRNIPGRIVGKTVDEEGREAYVLTLTAREQHIRRDKARSNICTNQGLCALTATVYLEGLGKSGIRKLALSNYRRAEYTKKKLCEIEYIKSVFGGPTFNEFVIRPDCDPEEIVQRLLEKKILVGIPLGRWYPDLKDCLLVTVTELLSKEDIDFLFEAMKGL
jgi:glycine dehydrogenase subunit 1